MNTGEKVIIVSVDDYTFSKVKEEDFYAFPESYGREVPSYIAFYRKAPISAITHFGKVGEVEKGGEIGGGYRLIAFGDRADEEAVVVKIEDLHELESPVERDESGGIRGCKYTDIRALKEAEKTSQL